MSLTRDILACYRRPGQVIAHRMRGQEADALTWGIAAGGFVFVSLLPGLARQAHLFPETGNLPSLAFGAFLGAVFLAPLLLYGVSLVLWGVTRLFPAPPSGAALRLVLFWAWLATTPLMLLRGLTAGFVGPGSALNWVDFIWGSSFLVFFFIGLWRVFNVSKDAGHAA